MHRRTDPRSPVQNVRDPVWLPVIGFAIGAAAYLSWQQWDWLVDWYDGELEQSVSGPRQAKANLATIFSTDDYPTEAERNEEQGTVAFHLNISRRGYVTDCQIVSSSGSKALDRATCRILENRAQYEPARDASGKRVPDEDSGRIRWVLPDE